MYDWEEMDVLMQLVKQINVGNANKYESASGWNQQMDLIYNQSKISETTAKANEAWSNNMVTNIYKWGQKDPYLEKLSYSIRLLYFHNLVVLEDLFMDKGHSAAESKKMALSAMNNMVGPYLNQFN